VTANRCDIARSPSGHLYWTKDETPTTLTFELELDNRDDEPPCRISRQRSFTSKVIVRRHTHNGPTAQPGPLKWSVNIVNGVAVDECRVDNVTYLTVDGRQTSVSATAAMNDVSMATPSNARLQLTIGQ